MISVPWLGATGKPIDLDLPHHSMILASFLASMGSGRSKWLHENCQGDWRFGFVELPINDRDQQLKRFVIFFEREEDAVLYRLTWD